MDQIGTEEILALIHQLEPIRDQVVSDKELLVSTYPNLDPMNDARITAFSKLINVFNSVQLSLTFLWKHLLNHSWWNEISREPMSIEDRNLYAQEFLNFTKLGFVQFIFSTVESSFRIFLRAIASSACSGGTEAFKSIYDSLFNSHLTSPQEDGPELLDLLRLIRNTIHNNGVYFHRNGIDAQVKWQGELYEFKHGVAVDFVSWSFIMEVADALRDLVLSVATDMSLQAITNEIRDPFSR